MEKINILNTKNYYRTYYVDDNKRPMIFICAGGGYQYTSPREEEPIMKIFFEKGYHVCIVNYREDNSFYPAPGMNVAYALNKMKNSDGSIGGHWNVEQTTSVAKQNGINFDSFNEYDLCYVMNMMYSDYYKYFGNDLNIYVKLTKGFLEDIDAPKGKALKYYLAMKD